MLEVPSSVDDDEKDWIATHPDEFAGAVVVERQTGDDLAPPSETCVSMKVIYNTAWVNIFGSQTAAATAAQQVIDETQRIYHDKFDASNRLNSRVTINLVGGGKPGISPFYISSLKFNRVNRIYTTFIIKIYFLLFNKLLSMMIELMLFGKQQVQVYKALLSKGTLTPIIPMLNIMLF